MRDEGPGSHVSALLPGPGICPPLPIPPWPWNQRMWEGRNWDRWDRLCRVFGTGQKVPETPGNVQGSDHSSISEAVSPWGVGGGVGPALHLFFHR